MSNRTNFDQPENAHVVFIKSISFQTTEANNDPESFPDMSNDPFTPAIARTISTLNPAAGTSADPFTTPGLVELPSCPVCLERMDDTSGLATIFCQHVFHCACLQKWRGSGCPVCRYTQEDPLHKVRSSNLDEAACSTCGITSNLWIWYVHPLYQYASHPPLLINPLQPHLRQHRLRPLRLRPCPVTLLQHRPHLLHGP